jgi:hypothetical protein
MGLLARQWLGCDPAKRQVSYGMLPHSRIQSAIAGGMPDSSH